MKPAERNSLIVTTASLDQRIPGVYTEATVIEHPGGSGGVEAAEIMVNALAGYTVEIKTVSGQGSKLYRAGPFSSQWEAGNVDILEGDWNKSYLDSMEKAHDSTEQDDMDASSGGFNRLVGSDQQEVAPIAAPEKPTDKFAEGTFTNKPINRKW